MTIFNSYFDITRPGNRYHISSFGLWWTVAARNSPQKMGETSHGPNRNRWFTVLQNGGSFHGYVKNNQMVPYKVCFGLCKGICPQNMVLLRILKFPLRCSMILRGGYNKCSIITKIYGYQVKITERYGHVFDEF